METIEGNKEKWQSPKTAPESGHFLALTDDGKEVVAHYACDLSGEEQPAFRGFFYKPDGANYFTEIKLLGWRPLDTKKGETPNE